MVMIQLTVLLVCIFIGARMSGIGLGVMGMIGLLLQALSPQRLRIDGITTAKNSDMTFK